MIGKGFYLFTQKQSQDVFCKKDVLQTFAKFTRKYLYRSQVCNFIKKETLGQVLPCEFCKILRTAFL